MTAPQPPEHPSTVGLDMATAILRGGLEDPIPVPGRFLIGVNPDALRIVLNALAGAAHDKQESATA